MLNALRDGRLVIFVGASGPIETPAGNREMSYRQISAGLISDAVVALARAVQSTVVELQWLGFSG